MMGDSDLLERAIAGANIAGDDFKAVTSMIGGNEGLMNFDTKRRQSPSPGKSGKLQLVEEITPCASSADESSDIDDTDTRKPSSFNQLLAHMADTYGVKNETKWADAVQMMTPFGKRTLSGIIIILNLVRDANVLGTARILTDLSAETKNTSDTVVSIGESLVTIDGKIERLANLEDIYTRMDLLDKRVNQMNLSKDKKKVTADEVIRKFGSLGIMSPGMEAFARGISKKEREAIMKASTLTEVTKIIGFE
jgi:hypothetical protein